MLWNFNYREPVIKNRINNHRCWERERSQLAATQ
jgi:fibrillarin-like rRNA methylase